MEYSCGYCGSTNVYEGFSGVTCYNPDCLGNNTETSYDEFYEEDVEDE
jgi:hypothetical protein